MVATLATPLQKAGILTTLRGVGGGFTLCRRPEDISLHEIINLMEGTTRINRCLEADSFCSRNATDTCKLHRYYQRVQSGVDKAFQEMTIDKLL